MNPEIPAERFEVFASGLDHPECCAFDRDGNLWAGGEGGQVYRIDPTGKPETITNLGGFCAGLAFNPDDRELLVCVTGAGLVRVAKTGEHHVFATSAGDHKIVAPNYVLFDSRGRIYLTDSGKWMQRQGFVLRFDHDGRGEVLAGPLGYANGLALSADERHLFMVESDSDSVLRFEIASDDQLNEPELYAEGVGAFPMDWQSTYKEICMSVVTHRMKSGELARIGKRCYLPMTAGASCSAGPRTWPSAAKTLTRFMSPTWAALPLPTLNLEFAASRWQMVKVDSRKGVKCKDDHSEVFFAPQRLFARYYCSRIMNRLQNKVAIVTGAAHGIGRAIADLFARGRMGSRGRFGSRGR